MAEQRQFEPRKKHYMDEFKLRLTAEQQPGGKRRPSLHVTVIANNPRIEVYTEKPDDKNKGIIQARMSTPAMYQFLERFMALLDEPPKSQYIMKNKKQGENREMIHDTSTVIGKDDEGRVYISVVSTDQDRPKIKFYFQTDPYHELVAGNGRKLTPAESSVSAARAWHNMIKDLLPPVLVGNFVERTFDKNASKGGYNQGKKPWQNRQQPQAQSSDSSSDFGFDDDLPL